MTFILTTLFSAIGFMVGSKILPGVHVTNFKAAVIVALLTALLNATLGTVLTIVSLGLLQWGILSFILTAIILRVADALMSDFDTDGFVSALLLAIIISLVTSFGMNLVG